MKDDQDLNVLIFFIKHGTHQSKNKGKNALAQVPIAQV